jgi:hypothetical protein
MNEYVRDTFNSVAYQMPQDCCQEQTDVGGIFNYVAY